MLWCFCDKASIWSFLKEKLNNLIYSLVTSNSFMNLLMFDEVSFLAKCLSTNFASERLFTRMSSIFCLFISFVAKWQRKGERKNQFFFLNKEINCGFYLHHIQVHVKYLKPKRINKIKLKLTVNELWYCFCSKNHDYKCYTDAPVSLCPVNRLNRLYLENWGCYQLIHFAVVVVAVPMYETYHEHWKMKKK